MIRGGRFLLALVASMILVAVASTWLFANTLEVRYERDVSRMVFNDNVELLGELRHRAGLQTDSLSRALAATPEPRAGTPYIVVSIEDHRRFDIVLLHRHGIPITTVCPISHSRLGQRGGAAASGRHPLYLGLNAILILMI